MELLGILAILAIVLAIGWVVENLGADIGEAIKRRVRKILDSDKDQNEEK